MSWSRLPAELQLRIGEMSMESEGSWECALLDNPVNSASTRRQEELVQLAHLCRLNRTMYLSFTRILWRFLSYSKLDDLCDKPNLKHVETLHLALETKVDGVANLVRRIVTFVGHLPTVKYAHVNICILDEKSESAKARKNLQLREKEIAEEQNLLRALVDPELDSVFTRNGAYATWNLASNADRWPIISMRGDTNNKLSAPAACGNSVLTFNAAGTDSRDDRGVIFVGTLPAGCPEAETADLVDADHGGLSHANRQLKIDRTQDTQYYKPTWDYLESVVDQITHLRVGSDGGKWYHPREPGRGTISVESDPWPVHLSTNEHKFTRLTTLSLHITTYYDLRDVRKLLWVTGPTLVNLDIRLENHLLDCLFCLVHHLQPNPDRLDLNIARMKQVHVHWAGAEWEWSKDSTEDSEALSANTYSHLSEDDVQGVREGHRHTVKRWRRLLEKSKDGEALRPLKEDLRAVLAADWKKRGSEFRCTGMGPPLDFEYVGAEYGENELLQDEMCKTDEEGDEDFSEGDEESSSEGSSEGWEGDEISDSGASDDAQDQHNK